MKVDENRKFLLRALRIRSIDPNRYLPLWLEYRNPFLFDFDAFHWGLTISYVGIRKDQRNSQESLSAASTILRVNAPTNSLRVFISVFDGRVGGSTLLARNSVSSASGRE